VADNGLGIPKADLKRVFEKFYRAEGTAAGGTGLGLPIAKGFIEAHKGALSVRNRTVGGAEFKIEIPIETEAGQQ
jgi:two-component system, OmpR family, sensor histidine kinase KdpD